MSVPNLKCSVEWCPQPTSPGKVLFNMPMETDTREKWMELLGTLPSTARKFFICSGHFPDEEFISGSLFRKLKPNATPSRNFFVRPLDINTNSSAPVKVEPDEELTAENLICRACMSECNKHYNSLLKPEILSLFESSTGVLLTKSRRLPNMICDECFETINDWQGFKKLCIKSNDVFTKRLEEESSTSGFIDISASSDSRKRSTSIVADNPSHKRQKINRQAPTSEDISSDCDNYSLTDDDDNNMDQQPPTSDAASACRNAPSSHKKNATVSADDVVKCMVLSLAENTKITLENKRLIISQKNHIDEGNQILKSISNKVLQLKMVNSEYADKTYDDLPDDPRNEFADIVELFPLATETALNEVEWRSSDQIFREKLVNFLKSVKPTNGKEALKCVRSFLLDECVANISYCGTDTKKAFVSFEFNNIVLEAWKHAYSDWNHKTFFISYFRRARERLREKIKRENQ